MNTTERTLINFACMIEEIYLLKLANHDSIVSQDYATYSCQSMASISGLVTAIYDSIEKLMDSPPDKGELITKDIDKAIKGIKKACFMHKGYDLKTILFNRLVNKGIIITKGTQYIRFHEKAIKPFKEQFYSLIYINLYKDVREKAHTILMQMHRKTMKYNELHFEEDKPEKKPLEGNLNFESELHKLGYNVVRLGEEQRQDLLEHTAIPKLGKKVVIARLEFFIKLGKNNPKFKTGIAMERWERDLKYVKSL